MTNTTVEKIKAKYIKKTTNAAATTFPKYKYNLQSEVNKVQSITRKISDKNIAVTELVRIKGEIETLLKVVDNKLRHGTEQIVDHRMKEYAKDRNR